MTYRVGVPAPHNGHSSCACSSCACCAEVRSDLVDAALDIADAWRASGPDWVEMIRQQPPHPSMQRLLDAGATLEHRHHQGSRHTGVRAALEADQADAGSGALFPPPARYD